MAGWFINGFVLSCSACFFVWLFFDCLFGTTSANLNRDDFLRAVVTVASGLPAPCCLFTQHFYSSYAIRTNMPEF